MYLFLLFQVFENVILPTHASCHVQFVMFLLCSFDQVCKSVFSVTHSTPLLACVAGGFVGERAGGREGGGGELVDLLSG